jgi:hypothetical protein
MSTIVRFEKLVNQSRLGEYTSTTWPDYDTPADYEIIENNKTGNFDVITFMQINDTVFENDMEIKFTRVVNWNYGVPDTFYTIDNVTHTIYTGFYNNTAWTGFSNSTGYYIGLSA